MADPITLAVIGTVVSAASSLQAGRVESSNLKFQQKQANLQARGAEIEGTEQQNLIREDLLKNLASANASFAARGVSISSGTPQQAQAQSIQAAEQSLRSAQLGAGARAGGLRMQGEVFSRDANTARQSSRLEALGTIASGGSK